MRNIERATSRPQNENRRYIENEILEKDIVDSSDWYEPEFTNADEMMQAKTKLQYSENNTFNPEKELGEILKTARSKEKDIILENFKNNLRTQRLGMAELQEELLKTVDPESKKIDYYQLKNIAQKYEQDYKFTLKQSLIIENMLRKAKEKNEIVQAVVEKYPDPKELYQHLYRIAPKGKITTEVGPVSIAFICENDEDYTRLYFGNFTGSEYPTGYLNEEAGMDQVLKSGGVYTQKAPNHEFKLQGTIIGARAFPHNKDYLRTVIKHEEQHALNRLYIDAISQIRKSANIGELYYTREVDRGLSLVRRHCREIINKYGFHAQDEIIAHSFDNGNKSKNEILSLLTKRKEDGGLYQYFDKELIIYNLKKNCTHFKYPDQVTLLNEARYILDQEYEDLVYQGINSLQTLKKVGYSEAEIVSILMPHRINNWPKIVERVSSKYIGVTSSNIEEMMPPETLNKIEELRKKLTQ